MAARSAGCDFADSSGGKGGVEATRLAGELKIVGIKVGVRGIDNRITLGFELVKGLLVIDWGRVNVGMVVRNSGNNGEVRVKFEKITVVFVGLVDEILVALVIGAAFSEAQCSADEIGDGEI